MASRLKSSLQRVRDGRMLCGPHRTSGVPVYHTPGCEQCEAARAKGIKRPDIDTAPARQRGRGAHRERFVDWTAVKAARKLRGEQ